MWISDFDPVQREIYDLSRCLALVGVTGTKGKTTTASLIAHLLNVAGIPAACTTTLHTTIPGDPPGPPCKTQGMMRDLLRRSCDLGIQHVVLETTSYSLRHELADFCVFTGGVFTNLGHEHLNYHGGHEQYLQAKRRLFISLGRRRTPTGQGWAVLNADDPASPELVQGMSPLVPVFHYGLPRRRGGVPGALDFYASRRQHQADASRYLMCSPKRRPVPIRTRLLGEFNVYNALAAAAASYCLGLSAEQVQQGLASFTPPPGRFEVIRAGPHQFGKRSNGKWALPLVIVDYAHTPESLDQVLQAARRLARGGRLLTVFGCGGQADISKRPLMGEVATRLSDFVILSNDNPRNEDPAQIITQILAGCSGNRTPIRVLLDRRQAIATAIRCAGPRDVVLVAGKGHETEQILADRTIPFADREVVREILEERDP